jgi:hypothetical protein
LIAGRPVEAHTFAVNPLPNPEAQLPVLSSKKDREKGR